VSTYLLIFSGYAAVGKSNGQLESDKRIGEKLRKTAWWDKRLNYIKSSTPAQQREDPVWLKLQSVYGDLHQR
jgi:hypothetical protein